jgi:hypothetical protein
MKKLLAFAVVAALACIPLLFDRPQPARAQSFPGQSTWGGTSTGSANSQAISVPAAASLSDLVGVPVSFIAGFTNAAGTTTLQVNAFTAKNVLRTTPGSNLAALGGGELALNYIATVMYDGTQFHLLNSARPEPPGAVIDYAGAAGCPAGFLEATGAGFSAGTYPALNTVLSTTWTSATLPDLRGRATFSRDIGGSGRITAANGNYAGTAVGNVGGVEARAVSQVYLPNINVTAAFAGASSNVSFPNSSLWTNLLSHTNNGGTSTSFVFGGTGDNLFVNNLSTQNGVGGLVPTTTAAGSVTMGWPNIGQPGGTTNMGSGTIFPVLPNSAIVLKCVRG